MSRTARMIRPLAVLALSSVLVPPAVAVTMVATLLFAPLPTTLPDARPAGVSEGSEVYLLEGGGTRRQIAVFRRFEQKLPLEKAEIPQVLKDAVVAAEDEGFYRHAGVDLRGTLRALLFDVRNRGIVQGGSTITQQYARAVYLDRERTLERKLREAVLARHLDRTLAKDEILFRYLATIYLGEGAYGVGAAAETYFRKPARQPRRR